MNMDHPLVITMLFPKMMTLCIFQITMESEAKLVTDGVILPQASNPTQTIVFPDGIYGEHEAKQRSLYHSVDVYHDGIAHHQISAGYYLSKITNRDTGIGLVDYTDTLPFFDKDASRETYIFTLADKYDYSDALQL